MLSVASRTSPALQGLPRARKNAARGPREFFTATCAACGGEARVPFEPKSDRPVYCSDCFAKMRENG